jgi:hypothetical protein
MRLKKRQIIGMLFWPSLAAIALSVAYLAYLDVRDTRRKNNVCAQPNAKRTAYLVINELEASSRRIRKARLMISAYDAKKDTLEISSVTPRNEKPGEWNHQLVFSAKPIASPTSGPPMVVSLSPIPAAASSSPSPSPTVPEPEDPWREIAFIPYQSQPFLYPFESYALNLQIKLERDDVSQPLTLAVVNNLNDLIAQPCASQYSFDNTRVPLGIEGNTFSVVLTRHRFVRATAVILYLVAVVFLVYIATREERTTVLSNTLGYLAALWGIRQIIVGYANLFPTAIDFITLALYLAVVAIVVFKLFISEAPLPRGRRFRRNW